jgi:hypothetical protein
MVIMGDNQVAVDATCCRIIGLDPMEVEHIRLAHERGFGPVGIDDIDLDGDVTLEGAQRKARGFAPGSSAWRTTSPARTFAPTAAGPPSDEVDYCWGGCPGAIEEAIEILRVFDKATDEKMPPVHVVFGRYDAPIDAKPGEKVVFIGDCAEFRGDVAGKLVNVPSRYVDRSKKSPYDAKDEDIFAKMAKVYGKMWSSRREDVVVLGGCPVSVAEQVLALVAVSDIKNPITDPVNAIKFNKHYLAWRGATALQRLKGQPYQVGGRVQPRRGGARGDGAGAQRRRVASEGVAIRGVGNRCVASGAMSNASE